ncbi:hypothetical protein ACWEA7_45100, partial [Streptomyces sp. NPDC005093]
APVRSEAVVPLSAGTGVLAATCRRLLAEAAADVAPETSRFVRTSRDLTRAVAHFESVRVR